MSSFYRPSNKTTAQANSAKLTRSEREALEENNLNILRASIERTLWCLEPSSPLAATLRSTQQEITRHSLSSLMREKQPLQVQEDSEDEDEDDDNLLPDEIFVQSSPLIPRNKRTSARLTTKLPDRRRPMPREQILPSIEKTISDRTSESVTVASAVFDSPIKENSATTAATSVEAEETKPEFKTPAKKRAAEDDYEPSAAKRIKSWLGNVSITNLMGGSME
ncbi:uncharacterized protein FIESC28_10820 [Fusarium coffeatum]|uniref:Uncharacterized protein n=1 Tax=Fusarium coffeatum TaxID=231269 RepID=A0A366QQ87_9HYPO|nr:uncharacterized protein FIESC28_10820 [Fusarium coffeatum]RBR07074.1 hypothetical protein FIESC28_10820 [Fusarium coffeatum]